jgi:uncharacterized membrane protein YbhN (UPF0104 family)
MGAPSIKSHATKYLNRSFRVTVILLLLAALWFEFGAHNNFGSMWTTFTLQMEGANLAWLLAALLGMPLNWLAETAKWRMFVSRLEPMPWRKAFAAILTGVSFALFTPNRLGEFGGRLLFVQPENQWKSFLANLAGSLAQFLVLLGAGMAGLYAFLSLTGHLTPQINFLALLSIPGTLLLLITFFNLPVLFRLLHRIPVLDRLSNRFPNFRLLENTSRRDLTAVLLWSIFRYFIYATQYVCMLRFLGIYPGPEAAYAGIALIFLLQTALPLPAFAGLLVRGNIAVFVWSAFGANEISSLTATFALWIINLILPALMGTVSIANVRITRTLGYENL